MPDGQEPGGWSILGMEVLTRLDGTDEAEVLHPIAALVVVKTLDQDGSVAYRVRATEGVSVVEAFGMAGYAADLLRAGFPHNCEDDGDA